jgi:hypothetical protein
MLFWICILTEINQSFFLNRIRLILKPKKTHEDLINLTLCLFEKTQFVKTFLRQKTTIVTNFFKIIYLACFFFLLDHFFFLIKIALRI